MIHQIDLRKVEASHAERALLRTWCHRETVQVCVHSDDDFQEELTSQNFQPKKFTGIGFCLKPFVAFHDFLNPVSTS